MKDRRSRITFYHCLGAVLLMLCAFSCSMDLEDEGLMNKFLEQDRLNPNLISNAGFEHWDVDSLPVDWEMEEIYNYSLMFSPSDEVVYGDAALQMDRNSRGVHRMSQKVLVEGGFVYEFNAYMTGVINNYAAGGIEVFSSSGQSIGRHLVANQEFSGFKKLSIKFISNQTDSIKVTLGFPDGMDATVVFDNIELRKSTIGRFSPIVQKYSDRVGLDEFSAKTFDSNIEKISHHLNSFLIEGYNKYLQSGQLSELQASDNRRKEFVQEYGPLLTDPYAYTSFTMPSANMANAYCQRTALVHSMILAQYNVFTRQIHWVKDGVGIHQFVEYWNPFRKEWIILDPFYGVKYKTSKYLGSDGVINLIAQGDFNSSVIERIDVGEFYFSQQEILSGWNLVVKVQRFGDIRYTLP